MKRILIIDDSTSVHAFVKYCFSDWKFEIESCFDGQAGIEYIKSHAYQFDLILLDWEMPVLDGPSTFAELKKLRPNTPVVMMTSRSSADDLNKMISMGVSEYVMKPYTKDILIAKTFPILGLEYENAS